MCQRSYKTISNPSVVPLLFNLFLPLITLKFSHTENIITEAPNTSLWASVTSEEIDSVINQLPANKVLGPNGMTPEFYWEMWATVKEDMYEAIF